MLISFNYLFQKYNIQPKGVIQVGAHWAEEHEEFLKIGVGNLIYIEPCEDAFRKLLSKFEISVRGTVYDNSVPCYYIPIYSSGIKNGVTVYHAACGDEEGEMTMYVSRDNQGQSNSLLKPSLHMVQHPNVVFNDTETVYVVRLDNIMKKVSTRDDFNILIMDVQGAEGMVLKGAIETLKNIDFIYTEINTGQTYSGNMELPEMDKYLEEFGFIRVETYMPSPNWTWGDAAYLKVIK